MPNLPYMPDSHLIDAISVRASGHHHRGLCVPMTRPLIVGPQFQQPDFHALTRSSRYAYSSHVHVLVCLLCVVPFVVAHVRFHCAALVSFRAVVLCGGVSCYHGVCVPLCCAVVCFCCRRVVLSFGFVQLCGAVVWFGLVSCRRVVSCRRFRAMVSCGAVVRFCSRRLVLSCRAVVSFRALVSCGAVVSFRAVVSCGAVLSCRHVVSSRRVFLCRRVVSCCCVLWCRRFVSCRGFVRCCRAFLLPSCGAVVSCRRVISCCCVVWCPRFVSCRGFVWCCRVFAVVSFCAVVCVLSCCRAVLTRVSVVRRAVLSCVSCVSVVPSCGAVVSLRARAVPVPCLR